MKKIIFLFAIFQIIFWLPISSASQAPNSQPPDAPIDAATKTQVINELLKRLNDNYVFLETAQKIEATIRERIDKKEYDQITSARAFAAKLTEDLQAVNRDKHLKVWFSPEVIPVPGANAAPTAEQKENYKKSLSRANHGFARVEHLPGNIGYIDLRSFLDPELGAETVAAAMNFVANTDALIFDLRQNGGGDPAMVALIISYLFGDKPVHLHSIYVRVRNTTEEYWTKPNAVIGKRYDGKDIYVLTSNDTISGGEEFAYDLKNLKRATIVGETTAGAANPGRVFRLSDHFSAFIARGHVTNAISKTNWEGTGVDPDVKVPNELALKTAHALALNKIAEKDPDEKRKKSLRDLASKTQSEIEEMRKNIKTN